jgi:hypothetical protein
MPSDKATPSENTRSHRHIDDPDSVFKGAHKLQPNDFEGGSFTVSDDFNTPGDIRDIWRVHLDAGETLRITTDTQNDFSPDTVVAVFDNNGSLLAFNDDNGMTLESFLEYEAQASGNYFVAVSQFPSFPLELFDPSAGGDFAHGGPEYSDEFWIGPGAYTLSLEILA